MTTRVIVKRIIVVGQFTLLLGKKERESVAIPEADCGKVHTPPFSPDQVNELESVIPLYEASAKT